MAKPILSVMRKYAASQGVSFTRVGVYRLEEGAEHFKQEEWDNLKSNPTFKEEEVFLDSLGGIYTVGLYVTPESTTTIPSSTETSKSTPTK